MGSSASNTRDAPAPPPPPPPPSAPPRPLHATDADEEDENVKQLNECAALYLSLQDCLADSNRNWKACQARYKYASKNQTVACAAASMVDQIEFCCLGLELGKPGLLDSQVSC